MKVYTQVYVMNSIEAAEFYCKAFDAEITRAFFNDAGTAYEHCELSVNGEGILALAEAKKPYDVETIHKQKLETIIIFMGIYIQLCRIVTLAIQILTSQ